MVTTQIIKSGTHKKPEKSTTFYSEVLKNDLGILKHSKDEVIKS